MNGQAEKRRRAVFGLLGLLAGCWLCTGCTLNDVRTDMARTHLSEGDAALQQRNFQAALAEFQEAVTLAPEMSEAHYGLGMAYKQSGDLESAADALQEAVRLDPENVEPVFQLGEVYRLLHKMTQAIRAYVIACELNPNSFALRYRLAASYHQTGELDLAVEQYKRAVELDPQNAYVRSNLGAALMSLGRDYEAIRAYKESLECNNAQPIVLVNLATVYLNQQRWATARRVLSKAIELAPDLSSAHERLGYCLWREEEYDAAELSYRRAVACDAKNAAAFAGLGVVRMTQYLENPDNVKLRDQAVECWHMSLELDPYQPKLRSLVDKYRPREAPPMLQLAPPDA